MTKSLTLLLVLLLVFTKIYSEEKSGFGFGTRIGSYQNNSLDFDIDMPGINLEYFTYEFEEDSLDRVALSYRKHETNYPYSIKYQALMYDASWDIFNFDLGNIYSGFLFNLGFGISTMERINVVKYKAYGFSNHFGLVVPIIYNSGDLIIGYQFVINILPTSWIEGNNLVFPQEHTILISF